MGAKFVRILALCLLMLTGISQRAYSDNWQASLYDEGLPSRLVGVDKKHATFHFFERKSPMRLKFSYPCVTGQLAGDKQQINDLRTPEGIYFVEYKIANGLDFREYGGIAYTLNYPNPVDRLRGKTGHGIWIHSKGFELTPTRGCIAIGLNDIAEVGPSLVPGTAVVLAEELEPRDVPKPDNGTAKKLRGLMREWSKSWAARSAKMFDYYDPDAYSRATENFSAFRQNKERLFKILSFIKIYNREIHALEGPGYWVTWSEQFYTASNLSTEGVRRLYWQKGQDGEFRIVGMEWSPRDLGMRADFQQGRLVAEAPRLSASDASAEAPLPPRLDLPEGALEVPAALSSPETLETKIEKAAKATQAKLVALSEPLVSKRPQGPPPAEITWGNGRKMDQAQNGEDEKTQAQDKAQDPSKTVRPPAPEAAAQAREQAPDQREENNTRNEREAFQKIRAQGNQEDEERESRRKKALEHALKAWNSAREQASAEIRALYAADVYNRLPYALGVPRGRSFNSAMRDLEREFAQPWRKLYQRPAQISINGSIAQSRQEEMLLGPDGHMQGERSLWWQEGADGKWRLVGADFKPGETGLAANYLEDVSGVIGPLLEAWRKAWQAGDIDAYMAFYAPDAVQQGRYGAENIRRQKIVLWAKAKPAQVQLSGLRLAMDKRGIRADMAQTYEDNTGRGDKGIKTLLLRFDGQKWRIQREDWADLRQSPGQQASPAPALQEEQPEPLLERQNPSRQAPRARVVLP